MLFSIVLPTASHICLLNTQCSFFSFDLKRHSSVFRKLQNSLYFLEFRWCLSWITHNWVVSLNALKNSHRHHFLQLKFHIFFYMLLWKNLDFLLIFNWWLPNSFSQQCIDLDVLLFPIIPFLISKAKRYLFFTFPFIEREECWGEFSLKHWNSAKK